MGTLLPVRPPKTGPGTGGVGGWGSEGPGSESSSCRAGGKHRAEQLNAELKASSPEHLLHMQVLEQRVQETNLEFWLNPHCPPRCDRNHGHPV
uniref:Uncharacterized protein n=1 Tax=Kryptolebias marmoratus TaxID=37003 RepID=A0A3Q3GEG6_KRYMA